MTKRELYKCKSIKEAVEKLDYDGIVPVGDLRLHMQDAEYENDFVGVRVLSEILQNALENSADYVVYEDDIETLWDSRPVTELKDLEFICKLK